MTEPIEPCPNPECGYGCAVQQDTSEIDGDYFVWCIRKGAPRAFPITCGYKSPRATTQSAAIALHNRIAKSVREATDWRQRAEAAEAKLTDAAAIIRRLAWLLRKSRKDTDAPAHAQAWLSKHGLDGSVLRDLPARPADGGAE